jgi:hypothetical protein
MIHKSAAFRNILDLSMLFQYSVKVGVLGTWCLSRITQVDTVLGKKSVSFLRAAAGGTFSFSGVTIRNAAFLPFTGVAAAAVEVFGAWLSCKDSRRASLKEDMIWPLWSNEMTAMAVFLVDYLLCLVPQFLGRIRLWLITGLFSSDRNGLLIAVFCTFTGRMSGGFSVHKSSSLYVFFLLDFIRPSLTAENNYMCL